MNTLLKKNKPSMKGFTFVEALVVLVIFSVMTLSFYQLYGMVIVNIIDSKQRLAAVEIANQELEVFRNTPYVDLSLALTPTPPTGSVGPGTILYDSTTVVGGATYRILREIYYIDDAEDGVHPTDLYPQDYKNVIITVLWGEGLSDVSNERQSVVLSSYFVPPSGNELGVSDGVVSINVLDENGPVSGITVALNDTNGVTAPDYSGTSTTDAFGNVIFASVPVGEKIYRVTVGSGSDGYEVVQTYPDYPISSFYPSYVDLTAIAGTVTSLTLETGLIPDLEFNSTDPFCNSIGNVAFNLEGGRIIGSTTDGDPVYINGSLSLLSTTTDASGQVDMDSVAGYVESSGFYTIEHADGTNVFWRLLPGDDVNRYATEVNEGAVFDCNIVLMESAVDSVFITVTDSDTGAVVPDAYVRLQNASLGYSVEVQTDKYGTVYFPENAIESLVAGQEYDIRVRGDGYTDYISSVVVSGLEQLDVTLVGS